MSGRKSTTKGKLKVASLEDFKIGKELVKNFLGKPPEITDEPTEVIISHLDIKLEHFTEDELDAELEKNKSGKPAGLNQRPLEIYKRKEFDTILLRLSNAVYKQNTI